jgi:transcriptional regulator with PAS, ATPase and Fis domain
MVLRRIVVLSKHPEILQMGYRLAEDVLVADDLHEVIDISLTVNPDLILVDGQLHSNDVLILSETTDKNHRVPIVIIGNDNNQSPKSRFPFVHYLSNTCDSDGLQQIINEIREKNGQAPFSAVNSEAKGTNNDFFADELSASVYMAGKSTAILQTIKMIKLVAGSKCNPVLIIGETGTGKELAARAVHLSRHENEKFVAVNCAALTATLLESELFGHCKGSFTGAEKDKTGLLELAAGGTIFLDEISEMPLDLQAKLLRVLQEKTFRKVGGGEDKTCNATIIASSNRDLRLEVRANRFRRDLYYRLNICPILIAPLRDPKRRTDIRLLAEYFLKNSIVCPAKSGQITAITEMALEAIEKHNWPGNVRELRNVIERAILLETTDKIGLSSIIIESEDDFEADNSVSEFNQQNQFSAAQTGDASDFSLEKAERQLIAKALQESGWQKTKAAALLGITRATLYAKVKQHNIQKGTYIPVLETVSAD